MNHKTKENMYTLTNDKTNNIEVAKCLLLNLGLKDFTFSGYSQTNFGTSIYFASSNDKKIRVSDHGVTNKGRIFNEYLFQFDKETMPINGVFGLKDNQPTNKRLATEFYKLV